MVHPSERNTVDLEGTGDEEDALAQVLKEDDTLATEAAGQEDQDSTGLEAIPDLRWADGLANLLWEKHMLEFRVLPQLYVSQNKYMSMYVRISKSCGFPYRTMFHRRRPLDTNTRTHSPGQQSHS